MGFRTSSLGFKTASLGFETSSLGFGTVSLGCRTAFLGFRASFFGFETSSLGFRIASLGFRASFFGLKTENFEAWRPFGRFGANNYLWGVVNTSLYHSKKKCLMKIKEPLWIKNITWGIRQKVWWVCIGRKTFLLLRVTGFWSFWFLHWRIRQKHLWSGW